MTDGRDKMPGMPTAHETMPSDCNEAAGPPRDFPRAIGEGKPMGLCSRGMTARQVLENRIFQLRKQLQGLEALAIALPIELPRKADEALADVLLSLPLSAKWFPEPSVWNEAMSKSEPWLLE